MTHPRIGDALLMHGLEAKDAGTLAASVARVAPRVT